MARIDYAGILRKIAENLAAQPETAGVRIYVEEDPEFGLADMGNAIAIYLNGRSSHPNQVLAANKRVRYLARITVSVFGLSIERFERAEAIRDDLLGNVELALMKDPTIGNTVTTSWLDGGEFASARAERSGMQVFVAAADINLVADVSAINP